MDVKTEIEIKEEDLEYDSYEHDFQVGIYNIVINTAS